MKVIRGLRCPYTANLGRWSPGIKCAGTLRINRKMSTLLSSQRMHRWHYEPGRLEKNHGRHRMHVCKVCTTTTAGEMLCEFVRGWDGLHSPVVMTSGGRDWGSDLEHPLQERPRLFPAKRLLRTTLSSPTLAPSPVCRDISHINSSRTHPWASNCTLLCNTISINSRIGCTADKQSPDT